MPKGSPGEVLTNPVNSAVWQVETLLPSERANKRLLWREDMENYTVCKWRSYEGVAVPSYNNAEIGVFEGDYVLRIVTAGTSCRARLLNGFGRLPLGVHALEIRWYKDANTVARSFELWNVDFNGNARRLSLRWTDNKWQYESALNVWSDVPNGAEPISDNTWNYLKIVGDFENNLYRRLVTNYHNLLLTSLNLPLIIQYSTTVWSDIILGQETSGASQAQYYDDARLYLYEED